MSASWHHFLSTAGRMHKNLFSLSPPIILCTCCTSSSYWLEEALKPPSPPPFSSAPLHSLPSSLLLLSRPSPYHTVRALCWCSHLSSPLLHPSTIFLHLCLVSSLFASLLDPEFLKTTSRSINNCIALKIIASFSKASF